MARCRIVRVTRSNVTWRRSLRRASSAPHVGTDKQTSIIDYGYWSGSWNGRPALCAHL